MSAGAESVLPSSQQLFLGQSALHVRVQPVVYASILSHYSRRQPSQHRVIGTLLGSVVGNVVEVSNSFPVPHNETNDIVCAVM